MATYRGGVQGHWLRNLQGLSREEAKHFLLHDAHGRALLRDTGGDIDELGDHLVEASNKREAPKMMDMNKTLREVGEHGFVKMVTRYGKTVHPTLTGAQAFTKVFTADDDEGRAIRTAWQIAKGADLPSDARDEPRDDTDDTGADGDALSKLEQLGAEVRKRNPQLTKAQAFSKAYSDPANVELVKAERRANRPRA
jgi:hypothetical protein